MRILTLSEKDRWNKFLTENNGSFLQSWEWGEFQESLSKKVWKIGIGKDSEILGIVQVIQERFPLKIKSFLYVPYGPCFKRDLFTKARKKIIDLIFAESRKIAKRENSIFLKIEPTLPWPKDLEGIKDIKRIQPKKTLILKLGKSADELLQNFHYKTRYNIKLSQRKGVKVRIINNRDRLSTNKYINIFYRLIQKTAKRNNFLPYEKDYYEKLLQNSLTELFLAEYKNKIIAANIVIFFEKRVTYLHGGADYKYRKIMASHLLQWNQIQEAKRRGYKEYDFWGISEKDWPGLTRFKGSFRGEQLEYPRGKDFIFQEFWYKLYRSIKLF